MKRFLVVAVALTLFFGCETAKAVGKGVIDTGKEVAGVAKDVAVDVAEAKVEKAKEDVKEKLSKTELWVKYNEAKAKLEDARNLVEKIDAYEEKALYAAKLQRDDIVAWQYNNIGYSYILMYQESPEKELLIKAKKYLDKAKDIDKNLNDKRRTEKIDKNLNFIAEHLK